MQGEKQSATCETHVYFWSGINSGFMTIYNLCEYVHTVIG